MSRHRSATYYTDRHQVLTPGLSGYRPTPTPTHSTRYANTTPRHHVSTNASTSSPRTKESRYHDDTYYASRSKPSHSHSHSHSKSHDKGLSYTSTRDIGGWLGGAALTAGAAYLLRGGGERRSGSKDGERERGRERGREREREGRRYDDDGGYYREKSRRRAKSEGRGRSSRHYYY